MNLLKKTVSQYLLDLSGSSSAPGGGSAAALSGCIGVALVLMAVNITLSKSGSRRAGSRSLDMLRKKLILQLNDLERLIELDAVEFASLKKMLKRRRKAALLLQKKYRRCAEVPLKVINRCSIASDIFMQAAKEIHTSMLPDFLSGFSFLETAVLTSVHNISENTKYIYSASIRNRIKAFARKDCARIVKNKKVALRLFVKKRSHK